MFRSALKRIKKEYDIYRQGEELEGDVVFKCYEEYGLWKGIYEYYKQRWAEAWPK